MNTPPTTPPALDRFESALLAELRERVASQPAPEVFAAPVATDPVRYRRRRWAPGAAVAAASATAFVVASLGGPGASPAYAVEQTADGAVVVTINRLEDSAGLEEALRDEGIDADVSFDPTSQNGFPDEGAGDAPPSVQEGTVPPRRDDRTNVPRLGPDGEGHVTEGNPAGAVHGPGIDPGGCGTGELATLRQEGAGWVLRIPAGSPLQDRTVQIATNARGDLAAFYEGDVLGAYCSVLAEG